MEIEIPFPKQKIWLKPKTTLLSLLPPAKAGGNAANTSRNWNVALAKFPKSYHSFTDPTFHPFPDLDLFFVDLIHLFADLDLDVVDLIHVFIDLALLFDALAHEFVDLVLLFVDLDLVCDAIDHDFLDLVLFFIDLSGS